MVKVKILTPKDAVKLARRLIQEAGFMEISKSPDSHYFKKRDANYKVRISDHKNTSSQYPDVAFNLVFDYNTIESDVVGRVSSVNRDYDSKNRNMRRSSNG